MWVPNNVKSISQVPQKHKFLQNRYIKSIGFEVLYWSPKINIAQHYVEVVKIYFHILVSGNACNVQIRMPGTYATATISSVIFVNIH